MNLNIEGTKHEKAVLVILSYVAGFTAGFIVFGLSLSTAIEQVGVVTEVVAPVATNDEVAQVPLEDVMQTNDDAAAISENAVAVDASDVSQEVLYKDGRLMANANGASVLLSAQMKTVDAETARNFAEQGVHESIPQYLASDDGNFIYYCEQHSQADSCTNFIYDVNSQIIRHVSLDGIKLTSTAEEAKTASWSGSILTVGTASSVTPEAPWKLVSFQ